MKKGFFQIVERFPEKLKKLNDSSFIDRKNLKNKKGIYVLYEKDKPVYVGRTRNLKRRLTEHGKSYSTHYSATLALKIAKIDAKTMAKEQNIDLTLSSKELVKNDNFFRLFQEAKNRISKMKIKTILLSDPVEQTLFEVFAALELKTQYNEWETH